METSNTTTTKAMQAIQTEATEMAHQLKNGNRADVREFIEGHEFPATLALAIVRNLWTMGGQYGKSDHDMVDAVLNVQALVEMAAI